MTNRQIAQTFQLLAKMMELHGENEFRIRAYRNAFDALKRLDKPVSEMSADQITGVKGIGKSTGEKISELMTKGSMERFDQYARKTPEGIRDMLMIKGLGSGKVKAIWKEMGIETAGELLYACNENRLVEFSGFGLKTQAEIKKQLEYFFESEGKYLWAAIEPETEQIAQSLKKIVKGRMDWVGEFARKSPIVESLECLVEGTPDTETIAQCDGISVAGKDTPFVCKYKDVYRFVLHTTTKKEYDTQKFMLTADKDFLASVEDINALPAIPSELMEGADALQRARDGAYDDLIKLEDIQGILHCHSTYSDGLHSLKEMAEYTCDAGYGYLGITDHSKSAVYARGLNEDRVMEQLHEIDELNTQFKDFRIYKGIEADILSDGSLDYDNDVLKRFDFIIASIHSGLKMDLDKATSRLIKAIENPYTRILGHMTGRLLLARLGYPVEHRKVIDACAANGVVIEVNANPQRLDMDSSFIPYAIGKGVHIAVNPDAHSRESIHNVRYGVYAARRGGLPKSICLNTMGRKAFEVWVKER